MNVHQQNMQRLVNVLVPVMLNHLTRWQDEHRFERDGFLAMFRNFCRDHKLPIPKSIRGARQMILEFRLYRVTISATKYRVEPTF